MANINLKYSYTNNPNYSYETVLRRLDMDKVKDYDIINGKGFIIHQNCDIKKDLNNITGIFSPKFGLTLDHQTPFIDKYTCECRNTMSKINENTICPICGTPVTFVDDNFDYVGWNVINDEYHIIHPVIYTQLESLIGDKVLKNILNPVDEKDKDGFKVKHKASKEEPYFGIGMMEFYEKFDEIIFYYYSKKKKEKLDVYADIIENRDIVFNHSFPTITALLRPHKISGNIFNYNDINNHYNMLAKLVRELNNDKLRMFKKKKQKKQLLYDIQCKINKVNKEIDAILSGKKGIIRSVFGGRYSFSARDVIVPDPLLEIDEVKLSYYTLVILLQQSIISFLMKSSNMSASDAYNIWYNSITQKDQRVYNIIEAMIKSNDRGLPILINRNPTLAYGGIDQMFIVGILDNYTMAIPLQILEKLGADFDGDVLNILYIINKDFFRACFEVFNPRNCHFISKNDGLFDNSVNHSKNIIINQSTFINLGRKNYSPEMIEKIKRLQQTS